MDAGKDSKSYLSMITVYWIPWYSHLQFLKDAPDTDNTEMKDSLNTDPKAQQKECSVERRKLWSMVVSLSSLL